jgi:hypothetical protein
VNGRCADVEVTRDTTIFVLDLDVELVTLASLDVDVEREYLRFCLHFVCGVLMTSG